MGDQLNGWRRKCGLVLLLIVFGLTSLWGRSFDHHRVTPFPHQLVFDRDRLRIGFAFARVDHPVDRVYQSDGCLVWETLESDVPIAAEEIISVWLNPSGTYIPDIGDQNDAWDWRWRWCGFANGHFRFQGPFVFRIVRWRIPFWSIVVPLTLLSGFLLLSRPKQSKPIPEPAN